MKYRANSLFYDGEKEYRPGEIVMAEEEKTKQWEEKGFVIGEELTPEEKAAEKAEKKATEEAEKKAAEEEAQKVAEEAKRKAAEKAAKKAAEKAAKETTNKSDENGEEK
ncbi:hypothetical protein [Anaerotignum propionicum]|uniref:hypothetical protein n=1 Tax=Anaerotignum propionicum TaxID=28446 RepID=UPI00289BF555|nr:hypothetical protein [Anaerotignum propionicum]